MRRFSAMAAVPLLLGAMTSCGADAQADGDCSARIDYQGVVYRSHNLVRESAPTGSAELGSGDVVGCEREAVDQVAVHAIRGVDPGVAIAVLDPDWRGLYVLEGTSADDWPPSIKVGSPWRASLLRLSLATGRTRPGVVIELPRSAIPAIAHSASRSSSARSSSSIRRSS